jgi:Flp pilus assembly protein TadG
MSTRGIISIFRRSKRAAETQTMRYRQATKASFWRSDSGAVAIYFGLSAIVFIGVAGLAVDAARGYLIKARLSEAIDAAALAGGKALQTADDEGKPTADALAFFNANFPTGAMGATVATPTISFSQNDTVINISGTATIPTTLMQILGFKTMTMAASASVARATSGLDVVFSFDVSGSMNDTAGSKTKIAALRENAAALVNSLAKPFTNGIQQQIVTINGTQYSLLNIGVVPWNAKVNVKNNDDIQSGTTTTVSSTTVSSFKNPVTGATQNRIYKASTSEVPLLQDPTAISGGWKGCVYARYVDDGDQTDDADITLGAVTSGSKNWAAWDPIPSNEGEDVPGTYQSGTIFGFPINSAKNCYESDWNVGNDSPWGGNPGKRPSWWKVGKNSSNKQDAGSGECSTCPTVGILPLQSDTNKVNTMIGTLTAGGSTNTVQGLFWAWEVLMPGEPFSEAVVSPPFPRAQAIVLMTDGLIEGSNGDSYRGTFGSGPPAGTSAHGTFVDPSGSTVDNTLKNRFLALASKIKGSNPEDPNAVKIYVIQYQQNDSSLTDMLQTAATEKTAPYYFFAPDDTALADAFNQIAASLSALRIVK